METPDPAIRTRSALAASNLASPPAIDRDGTGGLATPTAPGPASTDPPGRLRSAAAGPILPAVAAPPLGDGAGHVNPAPAAAGPPADAAAAPQPLPVVAPAFRRPGVRPGRPAGSASGAGAKRGRPPSRPRPASRAAEPGQWDRPPLPADDEDAEDLGLDALQDAGALLAPRPGPAAAAVPTRFAWPSAGAQRTTNARPAARAPNIINLAEVTTGTARGPARAAPLAAPAHAPTATVSGGRGLFRSQHETSVAAFALIPPRTEEERHSITEAAIAHVFCTLRQAEVTRPRTVTEDLASITAMKAQKYLLAAGRAAGPLDRDMHAIRYGPQACFRGGLTPHEIAQLMAVAVPFFINDPKDICATAPWKALRASATDLSTRLEAEIAACRASGREHPMSATIFRQIRKLLHTFFDLRAELMLPLMDTAPNQPHAAATLAIAGGYIDQAVQLHECLRVADDMIDEGLFTERGADPVVAGNAARTALARPFLLALLHGMERPKNTAQMIQDYTNITPAGNPAAAPALPPPTYALPPVAAPSFPPPKSGPANVRPTLPGPGTSFGAGTGPGGDSRGLPAGLQGALHDVPGRPGFRTDSSGALFHTMWYSGEYSCPPGWVPPPGYSPPAGSLLPDRRMGLTIPVAASLVTTSSPFTTTSRSPCLHCNIPGHAQYECPRRFFELFRAPLPGFLPTGEPDPAAWSNGSLSAAARASMAAYLHTHDVKPHRKYPVTLAHIAAGTAPTLQ